MTCAIASIPCIPWLKNSDNILVLPPSQLLAICDQPLTQFLISNLLHGDVVINRKARRSAGALAEHHEHRFHADGTECDV